MDNREASRAYIENMPDQEWHISQIDGLFENAFEIAAKEQGSSGTLRKISLKLKVQ